MEQKKIDYQNILLLILEEMRKSNVLQITVDMWFSDLTLISLNFKEAIFTTPLNTKRDVIMNRFIDTFKACIAKVVGFEPEVYILSSENGEIDLSSDKFKEQNEEEENKPAKRAPIKLDRKSNFTFDNFIVGETNKFACAIARAVSEKDLDSNELNTDNNPFFIYGPSGVGKTHLLYAITNRISERYPNKKITYMTSEEFTNQLVLAIQERKTLQFHDKLRTTDVLLIDDIQFIAGKTSTQEEFFNTFNAIYEDNKQIILTSDRPPEEIKTLETRLRTRFMAGMIADIQLPDYNLKCAILEQKASMHGISLSKEVISYIAENVNSSIRELEGIVQRLGAHSLLYNGDITIDKVNSLIKSFVKNNDNDFKRLENIILQVSKYFNINKEDIISDARTKEIKEARHICIYIARQKTHLSQSQIGSIMKRDRTTVLASEQYVTKKMDESNEFALLVKDIEREVEKLN